MIKKYAVIFIIIPFLLSCGKSNSKPNSNETVISKSGDISLFSKPEYYISKDGYEGNKAIIIIGKSDQRDLYSAKAAAKLNAAGILALAISGIYRKQIKRISKNNPVTGIKSYASISIETFNAKNVNVSKLINIKNAYKIIEKTVKSKSVKRCYWVGVYAYPYSKYIEMRLKFVNRFFTKPQFKRKYNLKAYILKHLVKLD